jgi:hypothetical protein
VKNVTSSYLKTIFEEHLNFPANEKGFWGVVKAGNNRKLFTEQYQ